MIKNSDATTFEIAVPKAAPTTFKSKLGAALGTAISNVVASLFFIIYFLRKSDIITMSLNNDKK
jgi:hypothetical protein